MRVTLYLFNILLQDGMNPGRTRFTRPYDSTQGVPGIVFVGFWVIILLFGIRMGWEYRDKIFPKNVPAKKKENQDTKKKAMTVDDFVKNIDHPLKKELIDLRKIIRESDNTLTEQIKWNAPSFCHNGDDRITFNLAKKDAVLLIFHRGAKAKKMKFTKPILTKNTDLLEWPSNDRGVMKFRNMNEVNQRREKLQSIVKEWIKVTSEYAA